MTLAVPFYCYILNRYSVFVYESIICEIADLNHIMKERESYGFSCSSFLICVLLFIVIPLK